MNDQVNRASELKSIGQIRMRFDIEIACLPRITYTEYGLEFKRSIFVTSTCFKIELHFLFQFFTLTSFLALDLSAKGHGMKCYQKSRKWRLSRSGEVPGSLRACQTNRTNDHSKTDWASGREYFKAGPVAHFRLQVPALRGQHGQHNRSFRNPVYDPKPEFGRRPGFGERTEHALET